MCRRIKNLSVFIVKPNIHADAPTGNHARVKPQSISSTGLDWPGSRPHAATAICAGICHSQPGISLPGCLSSNNTHASIGGVKDPTRPTILEAGICKWNRLSTESAKRTRRK
ncbi:hypothetical protein [Ruficoccus sp. ZRK36]|uniref:hypothetical protein n=1 Tax=Ruficoccus sp. ZRK36 TaxID=2866311 RepID=UPI001C73D42D|nr:hypothetical protein [Ruficoccus sp. ZRK36]QYY34500.1 hypothetical protein K0V07_09280 [Ruficoccus sp. ZRK36]